MKSESEREQHQTLRKQIIELLRDEEHSVREISQTVGLQEKEIYDHLSHIERSIASHGKKLIVSPYKCANCGFVFKERKTFKKPGRCPRCKEGHIHSAMYKIV